MLDYTDHLPLNPSQYGFRENTSTAHALVGLIDGIIESLNKKKYAIKYFKKPLARSTTIYCCKKWDTTAFGVQHSGYSIRDTAFGVEHVI